MGYNLEEIVANSKISAIILSKLSSLVALNECNLILPCSGVKELSYKTTN